MGMIAWLAFGMMGLVAAAFSRILADEFKAWSPTLGPVDKGLFKSVEV